MNETRRTLLDALAGDPVTGPELADRLGVSRAAVWKQVEALREAGFGIESDSEGYAVTEVPPYGAAAIAYGLAAPYRVEYRDSLDSTNDRARELAAGGESDVVVVADEQTGGRGRLRRAWTAPSGGVWASIVRRPAIPPAHAPIFTLAAAVAVTRSAREAGVDAGIKWPNDVLVRDRADDSEDAGENESDVGGRKGGPDTDSGDTDGGGDDDGADDDGDDDADDDDGRGGAKLAGILTEMEGEADRIEWIVVGVGVNADVDAATLPAGATSLRERLGGDVDRRRFLQRILETFHDLTGDLDGAREGGDGSSEAAGADESRRSPDRIAEDVLTAWRRYALTPGRRVRIETPGGTVEGEAIDVAFPGALVVETDEGRRRVHAGDCEHLRPA